VLTPTRRGAVRSVSVRAGAGMGLRFPFAGSFGRVTRMTVRDGAISERRRRA